MTANKILWQRVDQQPQVLTGAYAGFWMKRGTANDPTEFPGLAHLFEHLHVAKIVRTFQKKLPGVKLQAWTDLEWTWYALSSQASQVATLEEILTHLAQPQDFTQKEVTQALNHISQEVWQREQSVEGKIQRQWRQLLFPDWSGSRPTLGRVEILKQLTSAQLTARQQQFWPQTSMAAILLTATEKKTWLRSGSKNPFPPSPSVQIDQDLQPTSPFFAGGYSLPNAGLATKAAWLVVEATLNGGWTSPLNQVTLTQRGKTYALSSQLRWFEPGGYLRWQGQSREPQAVLKQIQRISSQPLTDQQLQAGKQNLLAQLARRQDRPEEVVRWWGEQVMRGDEVLTLSQWQQRVQTLSTRDVLTLTERILTPENWKQLPP